MLRINLPLALLILLGISFSSCQEYRKEELRIAISKEKPPEYSQNYSGWLKRHAGNIVWYDLYPLGIDSALKLLETCDGLIITGGEDVYPGNYGKINDTARCGTFDRYRDSLEFALISAALERTMPLVGICRGLQIINVARNGTLIVDIPEDHGDVVVHQQDDWENCFHPVFPVEATNFNVLVGGKPGHVASNHHQGIAIRGEGLQISAYAADSIPEAIEWDSRGDKSFLMAVQWHPERMDTLDRLSAPIAQTFLAEAALFKDSR